ncbi:hypothetical protein PCASD_20078 [Puccinia coronata f. sp. avenae]|uniref:Uncharacterized protein n=1 Tax=Puccinia coronata f. sp. avenae TaxID=200324 RepID=A0A2N5TQ16_9BASI|nr:hypothetical protein PCASD_20078 [Puccinia coronata f. sp. avenae]
MYFAGASITPLESQFLTVSFYSTSLSSPIPTVYLHYHSCQDPWKIYPLQSKPTAILLQEYAGKFKCKFNPQNPLATESYASFLIVYPKHPYGCQQV